MASVEPNTKLEPLAETIRQLLVGETVSRSARFPLRGEDAGNVAGALQRLRNQMNQSVGRVRKQLPGSYFRVESTSGLTDSKTAIIATVAVTRLNHQDADDEEVDI